MRPAPIKAARAAFAAGELDAAGLKEVEDREIRKLISRQKAAGYHTITDGEFRRSYWHLDFMWGLQGLQEITLTTAIFSMGRRPPRLCAGGGQDQRRESPLCGAF